MILSLSLLKNVSHKIILIISLLLSVFVFPHSYAQIRSVPAQVTEALRSKYPASSNVAWKDKLHLFGHF